jgi:hypothetical protein
MANSNSSRTVLRMNLGAMQKRPDQVEDEANTIFYLMTHTPHERDFSIFGPFHKREAFLPSLAHKVIEKAPTSVSMLDDMFGMPGGLQAFVHVDLPLPENKTMHIWVHKEENAEVKKTLPGPAFVLVLAEPFMPLNGLKSKEIKGTFVSAEAVNLAAKDLLMEEAKGLPGAQVVHQMNQHGLFDGVAMSPRRALMVQAYRDSGDIV